MTHRDGKSDARFTSTHWSVILEAQGTGPVAESAIAQLCQKYWYPIYAFLRRKGESPHDAEDLTQGLFEQLLARDWLAKVIPEAGGKFRTFLLACLENFLRNEHRRVSARKRTPDGQPVLSLDAFNADDAEARYSLEPATGPEPSTLYEIKWAETLIGHALQRLKAECIAEGKAELFEALRSHLTGDAQRGDNLETARALKMDPGAVRTATSRLRDRFREIFRTEVAETVNAPRQINEEIRYMMTLWSR